MDRATCMLHEQDFTEQSLVLLALSPWHKAMYLWASTWALSPKRWLVPSSRWQLANTVENEYSYEPEERKANA
eukprot:scaffold549505_cov22-Prasinocladus_malaysianus.AAC.1